MKLKQKRRFVNINGVKLYTTELEEEGLPKKKIINQLRRSPQVHLEKMDVITSKNSCNSSPISTTNRVLLTETSKNHPNLANVANYVECSCSNEEQSETNSSSSSGRSSPSSSFVDETTTEVFSSLKSLFGKDGESLTPDKNKKTAKKIEKKKKKRCHSTQELLISIFGSSFDDDEEEEEEAQKSSPPKQAKIDEKISLPVSIAISAINPALLAHQSKPTVDIVQVPALQQRCEFFSDEYTNNLVRPFVESEVLEWVVQREEFGKALVTEKDEVFRDFRTVKTEKKSFVDIVDLTLDESPKKKEQEKKPVNTTGVPVLASMPLLSPDLPNARPTLPETTRCEKSVRDEVKAEQATTATAVEVVKENCVIPVFKIQVKPKSQMQAAVPVPAPTPVPEKTNPNQTRVILVAPEEKKTPALRTVPVLVPIFKTDQRHLVHIAPKPQNPPVQKPTNTPTTCQDNSTLKKLLNNCVSANFPPPYPLMSFVLISNELFGDKLYFYCALYMFWHRQSCVFVEASRVFENSSRFQQNMSSFSHFIDLQTKELSHELIQELQTIDVDNFDLNIITQRIQMNFGSNSPHVINIPKICKLLILLIEPCAGFCTTPFTKKLFNVVAELKRRMQEQARSSQQAKLFSAEQRKLLHSQILQYLKIVETMNMINANAALERKRYEQRNLLLQEQQLRLQAQEQQRQRIVNEMQAKRAFAMLQRKQYDYQQQQQQQKQKSMLPPQLRLLEKTVNSIGLPESVQQINNNFGVAPTVVLHYHKQTTAPAQPASLEKTTTTTASTTEPKKTESSSVVNNIDKVKQEPICDSHVSLSEKPTNKQIDVKTEVKSEIIDLTWMDDCDDDVIFEEIVEYTLSQIKPEIKHEQEEVSPGCVSPTDSGVGGSPVPLASFQNNENYKCLCGEEANFTCACDTIYCSTTCQLNDWSYHKTICTKVVKN